MALKEKILLRMEEEATWPYLEALPATICGMEKRILCQESEDRYEFFSYENQEKHLSLFAYFHQETEEYKVRVKIGLTEFCLLQYITAKQDVFQNNLEKYLLASLDNITSYHEENISYITQALDITNWEYGKRLPATLEGFQLFISPERPVRVLNGSYIILDYSDFSLESNFIIYYNEFRCEFFGEAKINNIPEMNYTFDAKTLEELAEKLDLYLQARLQEIRGRGK